MATNFSADNFRLTTYLGSVGGTAVRQWTLTTAASATRYRAAGFLSAAGSSAAAGTSDLTVNDLVLVISSVSGVSWNYVTNSGTGTIAATV